MRNAIWTNGWKSGTEKSSLPMESSWVGNKPTQSFCLQRRQRTTKRNGIVFSRPFLILILKRWASVNSHLCRGTKCKKGPSVLGLSLIQNEWVYANLCINLLSHLLDRNKKPVRWTRNNTEKGWKKCGGQQHDYNKNIHLMWTCVRMWSAIMIWRIRVLWAVLIWACIIELAIKSIKVI